MVVRVWKTMILATTNLSRTICTVQFRLKRSTKRIQTTHPYFSDKQSVLDKKKQSTKNWELPVFFLQLQLQENTALNISKTSAANTKTVSQKLNKCTKPPLSTQLWWQSPWLQCVAQLENPHNMSKNRSGLKGGQLQQQILCHFNHTWVCTHLKKTYCNSHVHTDLCVHTPENDTEGPSPLQTCWKQMTAAPLQTKPNTIEENYRKTKYLCLRNTEEHHSLILEYFLKTAMCFKA